MSVSKADMDGNLRTPTDLVSIAGAPFGSRDYVMNSGLREKRMGRVGRPFQGRRRDEARRQAKKDRAAAGNKSQVRFTISVEKYSTEWSLIEPNKNRSEFIRECVREYPTLLRTVNKLQVEIAEQKALIAGLMKCRKEAASLREIVEQYSIQIDEVVE